MSPNLKAFLDAIAHSELGASLLQETDNGYNVLVGATPANPLTFPSYDQHPNILNAALNSTAAGRYQFLHRTWVALAAQLGLSDFSPESQDAGCVELVRECRALPDVEAGNFDAAVALCAHIWASLPGAGYGQHENKMAALRDAYTAAGGALA